MFTFADPWYFLLLPLPIIIFYLFNPGRIIQGYALKIPFLVRVQEIANKKNTLLKTHFAWRKYLLIIAWLSYILALANPQWLGKPQYIQRSGRNIMLAIDLSGSMRLPDMSFDHKPVSRLFALKKVATQFIHKRQGDRLGLILFGTKAYLQTPLTFDLKTVQSMLNDATIGLAGIQTAIGDAIGLAVKKLMNYPAQSRVLILMTDGGNNAGVVTPLAAAKIAAKLGIKVYTIGLGSERLVVPGLFGPQVINPSQDLDVKTLQQIAKLTHGQFFRAKNTKNLQSIYQQLNRLEPVSSKNSMFRPVQPLYFWPLAFALLLCFIVCLSRYIVILKVNLFSNYKADHLS